MALIKNDTFKGKKVAISKYVVQFSEDGVANIEDDKLHAELLGMANFYTVEEPKEEEKVEEPKEEEKVEEPKEEEKPKPVAKKATASKKPVTKK